MSDEGLMTLCRCDHVVLLHYKLAGFCRGERCTCLEFVPDAEDA